MNWLCFCQVDKYAIQIIIVPWIFFCAVYKWNLYTTLIRFMTCFFVVSGYCCFTRNKTVLVLIVTKAEEYFSAHSWIKADNMLVCKNVPRGMNIIYRLSSYLKGNVFSESAQIKKRHNMFWSVFLRWLRCYIYFFVKMKWANITAVFINMLS